MRIARRLCTCLLMLTSLSSAHAEDPPARAVRQIIAHRGSSADRPENTMASTLRAIEAGATAVEVDVRMTKDGALVLSHDPTVNRTTDGSGKINGKSLVEMQRLDAGRKFGSKYAGERVPTLEQVLTLCRGRIDVLLDLKEDGEKYDRTVAETVTKYGEAPRIIVGVRSIEQAKKFRALLPQARQLGLIEHPKDLEAYAQAGVEMVRLWPSWLPDAALVNRLRKLGVKMQLNGTTGKADEVVELLKYRPDSLSSDDPARLVATLAALGR